MSNEIYSRITEQIIAAIEKGTNKYEMPWHTINTAPTNAVTGKAYKGVNILSLWASADCRGYSTGLWGTYKQWQQVGAQVKKGEKASFIVFYKLFNTNQEQEVEDSPTLKRSSSMLATSSFVFNADQVEGYTPPSAPIINPEDRIDSAEMFFNSLGATIKHGGNRAYYEGSSDSIQMPQFEVFNSANSYYANLAHEVIHWTGHSSRCNRNLTGRFATESYAAEELIAELGAAFICSLLKLNNEPREDHASYMASWLKLLKHDNRAVFTAASKAQQAVDWLEQKQTQMPIKSC